ncbi:MAG TPA: PAN domain-containing protein [Polyangiaceae bacterium]|nr:PAN domain-containing protein [Polyangiaceae bacterium]
MVKLRSVVVVLGAVATTLCVLAQGPREASADEELTSGGFRYRVTPGKDIPGGDFLGTQARTPFLCATYCSNDLRCAAYTFVEGVAEGSRPNCWLKAGISGASPNAGVTSGVRVGVGGAPLPPYGSVRMTDERGATRVGGDYKKIELTPAVIAAARDAHGFAIAPTIAEADRPATACGLYCFHDARCVAATATRPTPGSNPVPLCMLKDRAGAFQPDANAYSTVKLMPPPPLR